MYLGIFIVNIILYIFELIYKTIENFNDYENSLYNTIVLSGIINQKKYNNLLIPERKTIKIFRSSFIN